MKFLLISFIPHDCQTQSRWPWRHHTHPASPLAPYSQVELYEETKVQRTRGGCFLKIKWRPPGGVRERDAGQRRKGGTHRRAVLRLDLQNKRPRGPVQRNGVARWSRQGTRDNWIKTVTRQKETLKRSISINIVEAEEEEAAATPRDFEAKREVDDLDSKSSLSSWKKQSLCVDSNRPYIPDQEKRKKIFQRTAPALPCSLAVGCRSQIPGRQIWLLLPNISSSIYAQSYIYTKRIFWISILFFFFFFSCPFIFIYLNSRIFCQDHAVRNCLYSCNACENINLFLWKFFKFFYTTLNPGGGGGGKKTTCRDSNCNSINVLGSWGSRLRSCCAINF